MLSVFPANDYALIAVILGMPLLGAFVNGVWGKQLGKPAVRLMALAAVGFSFAAALVAFGALAKLAEEEKETHVRLVWSAWQWMSTTGGRNGADVPIDVKFSIDQLSGVMMLVVTGVGFLIHLYATSYMAEDPGYARFFAYLNLFVFSMLVLILGDNLPILFVGWEGVGLCSYLLIGFWYENGANAAAGKKAFIANRIGDFGLLCAMFLLVYYTGALDWNGIANGTASLVHPGEAWRVHVWPLGGGTYGPALRFLNPSHPFTISAATAVSLALLLGCTGKSAQIPLYVWLPDAMAGPTPVSALIHAATMVTAGIYLVCRLSFVFVLSPFTMMVIAIVGAATALFAATIALVQNDIKKVLAYSTVSQLGFMFLGVGVGAFTAGFFHVFTHAFFKACLFLGAGSVIHAMHARIHDDEKAQDIRRMGGLRKWLPLTHWTFAASTAAIIGLPFTSGFFSKDEILFRAYVDHTVNPMAGSALLRRYRLYEPPAALGPVLYWVGVVAATLTAFYMCRLYFLTFWGDFRGWTVGRPSFVATHERRAAPADDDEPTRAGAADGAPAAASPRSGLEREHEEPHHVEDLAQPGRAPHESPWQMTVPLIILATFSLFAGVLNPGFHILKSRRSSTGCDRSSLTPSRTPSRCARGPREWSGRWRSRGSVPSPLARSSLGGRTSRKRAPRRDDWPRRRRRSTGSSTTSGGSTSCTTRPSLGRSTRSPRRALRSTGSSSTVSSRDSRRWWSPRRARCCGPFRTASSTSMPRSWSSASPRRAGSSPSPTRTRLWSTAATTTTS